MSKLNANELKWYSVRLGFLGKFFLFLFGVPALLIGLLNMSIFIYQCFVPPIWGLIKDNPQVNITPTELQDKKILAGSGVPENELGYSFALPWSSVTEHYGHSHQGNEFYSVSFTNDDGEDIHIDLDQVLASFQEVDAKIRTESGQAKLSVRPTKYEVLSTALNTTSDDIRIWATHWYKVRIQTALVNKMIYMSEARRIQRIQFGEMRGFEFSNAPRMESLYSVILFDKNDNALNITYFAKRGEPESLTQEKINTLVASIRPITAK